MKVSTISSYSLAAAALLTSAAANEAATPAPTTTEPYYDEELGCWPISVEHDATYCIDGPICSGSGTSPAGSLCPVKGDTAIVDCHSYLASYADGDKCVLPVDATCQVIHTGAWGCVIPGSSYPTPAPTKYDSPTPAPTKYGNGGGEGGNGGGEGGNGGNNGGNSGEWQQRWPTEGNWRENGG
ncbi:uncharacterized protein PITG_16999 [Phytophthora infestans T30-4]|uniref:Uncharacterized protein n=1 Tax=Phytophthora infestans (strain T30-4) TaxID=403677 RepID=D0NUJ8_PHYIT|nr:uncharacterized protein PITG_16999 [Phytophthora infestans T30-4]EEY65344.1 conserved hypothetical protein [Phytophthora infestans T30-4]|eukprot:XP_002897207.1 conserved hypothetical protein [Phytophthora infestans T30-4]